MSEVKDPVEVVKDVAKQLKDYKLSTEDALKELQKDLAEAKKDAAEGKAVTIKLDEMDKKIITVNDYVEKMQAEFKQKRLEAKAESFRDQLFEGLKAKSTELSTYGQHRQSITVKAVGDMGAGNFISADGSRFVPEDRVAGVARKPYETIHIRSLLPSATTTADTIYVIRDNGGEGGPATTAAGELKPESDRDYAKVGVPVTKIAHYYRIPEEWLNDLPWLASEISTVGLEELMAVEDGKLLNNNVAGEFQGLNTVASAFAAPASLAAKVILPNNYDVMVAAQTQLRLAKHNAIGGIVNPGDYAAMILSKSTTGEYVFGAPNIAMPNVFGMPIYPHTSEAADNFLIGDFRKAIFTVRDGISVRFYDQDRDNAIRNMVTVVIEERITMPILRPEAFIKGTFTAAKAALALPTA